MFLEFWFADLTSQAFFGLTSGLISVVALAPYIKGIVRGKTRPQRASWLIWSVLSIIAFFSQVYEGAGHSLWFAGVQSAGCLIVLALAVALGANDALKRTDYLILFAAGVGIALWSFTENAAWALAITISISLLGGVATARSAYSDPAREPMSTWAMFFVASICAILAINPVDWVLLAYPIYLFVLNGVIVIAIVMGASRSRQTGRGVAAGTMSH